MSYQRRGYGGGGYGGQMGGSFFGPLTPTVLKIIIANLVVFGFTLLAPRLAGEWLSLVPRAVFPGAQIWRLFTYMFVHADFAHILFNMLTLWWFGSPMEQIWGPKRFLIFYFLTGVGSGVVCVPFYYLADPLTRVVGASGAIFGILAAFAATYPNARVYLWFLFPVKVKYLVIGFMAIELLATMSYVGGESGSNVASIAHLSGAAIGYFYLRGLMDIRAWIRNARLKRARSKLGVVSRDDESKGPWLH